MATLGARCFQNGHFVHISFTLYFTVFQSVALLAQNTLRRNAAGWKRNFQYAIFVLEFAGPLVSKRGFDPQYASVFDRYAASTRSLLEMFRFNFNTKFGKDKKPIKIRPATQNTQRVEISIRNATRRKRNGSGQPMKIRPAACFCQACRRSRASARRIVPCSGLCASSLCPPIPHAPAPSLVRVVKTVLLANGHFAGVTPAIFVIFVDFRRPRSKVPCFCGQNAISEFSPIFVKTTGFRWGQNDRFPKRPFRQPWTWGFLIGSCPPQHASQPQACRHRQTIAAYSQDTIAVHTFTVQACKKKSHGHLTD